MLRNIVQERLDVVIRIAFHHLPRSYGIQGVWNHQ